MAVRVHFLHCLFMYYHAPFRLVCFYLTESKSAFCALFDIGALFRSRSHHLYLTESCSPSCTLFDIGALFRSRSHHLYLTESRSPFFCHRQRSSLFLPQAAVITRPLFVRLVSLAPLAILRNSQIKNLPSPATGGGRFFIPIFWRQQRSYRPES